MLNRRMNIRKMVSLLQENNVVNKPFLLSLNDYHILKEVYPENMRIGIIKECIESFDKIGIYEKAHYEFFRKAIFSKKYNKEEIYFLRNCLRKNNKRFFILTMDFCRFENEDDFKFYNFILERERKPVFADRKDYAKILKLVASKEGILFLNSFQGQKIENINVISKVCKNLYENKIEKVYQNFKDRLGKTNSLNSRVRTRQINSIKKLWNREMNILLSENPKVLEIPKIREIDILVGGL